MNKILEYIGIKISFCLPIKKIDENISNKIHNFLISHFNAYTSHDSESKGFWRETNQSNLHVDDNKVYEISLSEDKLDFIIYFLKELSIQLDEDAIYITIGEKSYLIKK